ncbi:NAD(P)H-dependent glycerol-3-phosphate dehydrogenase [uncultured Draconibacterium sp.]|uniref:NAD(P)H-dependent glycerol-3-phosphate dehydrogenase n=1 Tax=uncultured Draconibacterium sp. TaxID=1573823 RepID=UPI002AA7FF47|nr:NAD(P)H-dependent glycerol-3-phosphate dehydrogenase [uncultured Draconibacterium sp.]
MNIKTDKVGIIGSGSWATALAKILLENVNEINWYFRKQSTIETFKKTKHNPRYLDEVEFDTSKINFCDNINCVVSSSDILIIAVPSAFLPTVLADVEDLSGKYILSGVKGIVTEENLLVAEYLQKYFNVDNDRIGVLAGPCHAEEVAREKLSYLTVACTTEEKAIKFTQLIECDYIYTSASDDIWGTEYAAVLKNIIAIAAGIAHGQRFGDNFHAVLISRAIQEMKRFVDKVHPINRDIKAPAYLGDLMVTAYSQFSRNRTFGTMIGKGYSVKAAQLELNMVAEGYYASQSIHQINEKHQVEMPICEAVYDILYNKIPPHKVFAELTRKLC